MITENLLSCCGCLACGKACPKGAISFVENKEGFLYPKIANDLCINCGICNKVCPLNNQIITNQTQNGYTIKSNDSNIRKEASSGGLVTQLLKHKILSGWSCYGVRFTDDFSSLINTKVESVNDLQKFSGSKYFQSSMDKVYHNVENDLKNNQNVLFVGTPCQLNGIVNYLSFKKISLEHFYSVDLVCHGVSSPEVWKQYKSLQEGKYKSKIKYVNFRYKTFGYHNSTMKLGFENGKDYYGSGRVDYMLKPFFSEISSRMSCYDCVFKTNNRISDITVFDGWYYHEITGLTDDNKGYTNAIINSDKGYSLLQSLAPYVSMVEANVEKMINCDGIMYNNSAKQHQYRVEFMQGLKENGLQSQIKRYIPVSCKDRLIELLKNVYYFKRRNK